MNKLIVEIVIFAIVLLIFLTLIFGHINPSMIKSMMSNWTNIAGIKASP